MELTVIIPVHEFTETVSKYLKVALNSISSQEMNDKYPEAFVVCTPSIVSEISKIVADLQLPYKCTVLVNEGNSSFQGQVNFGASKVTTKYFTILEFDDELSIKYVRNYNKYVDAYPNISIFLPILVEVNEENKPLKLTNEPAWAKQFVGENGVVGYLNPKILSQYSDFKIAGAIIKTSDFLDNGMLKTKIDLTFNYEFLLRYINMGYKVFVLPKTLYKHVVTRPDSLFAKYGSTMSMKERKFWFDIARKESNFTTDREINKSELLVPQAE